jgi:hypothetical protein
MIFDTNRSQNIACRLNYALTELQYTSPLGIGPLKSSTTTLPRGNVGRDHIIVGATDTFPGAGREDN